jgi:hypothetical protein
MRTYVLTVALGLLAVAAFDITRDPAHRWHAQSRAPSRNWGQDQVWVSPAGYDERAYVRFHLDLIDRPDVLLLGSSKILLADSSMFPGKKVFNSGLSGASVEDYISVWQALKAGGKLPRSVVAFVEPWFFNRHSGQVRWKTNAVLYKQFVDDHGGTLDGNPLSNLWRNRLQPSLAELQDVFTWSTFRAALLARRDDIGGTVIPLAALPVDRGGRRFDGSFVYPPAEIQPMTVEQAARTARQFVSGDVFAMRAWEADDETIRRFDVLLSEMVSSGAGVTIVQPPYQPFVLEILRKRPDMSGIFSAATRILERSTGRFSNRVHFCDVLDAAAVACGPTDFFDGTHQIQACTRRILERCGVRPVAEGSPTGDEQVGARRRKGAGPSHEESGLPY